MTPLKPIDHSRGAQNWHDEFRVWPRTPFPGGPELLTFLSNGWPTEVLLSEGRTTTSIMLRFPLSSRQLPKNLRDAYSNSGISLSRAFSEIVWRAPRLRERSYWAILAKAAHDAYLQAWMHLLTVAYRKHFDPKADEKLGGWLHDLELLKPSALPGRRREVQAETKDLRRRFRELLPWCEDIYKLVEKYNFKGLSPFETRLTVFKKIYGQRGDDAVLSGSAFERIPYSKNAVLHKSRTWKPNQLAIALLSVERDLQYATVERKVGSRDSRHTNS